MRAVIAFASPNSFYWEKDNEALGVTTDLLSLLNAQISDSGFYEVIASHSIGEKASSEMRTGIPVTVKDSKVPAAGIVTLTGLVCVVALFGVRRLGDRKK